MKKKQEGPAFNTLKSTLREGKIERVYLLGGEEGYLAENLISSIVAAAILPGFEAVDCVRLDGTSRVSPPDLDRLEREVGTPAFASARRMVIAPNSGLFAGRSGEGSKQQDTATDAEEGEETGREVGKDQQKRLIRLLDSLSDGICLIYHEDKIDRRQKALLEAVTKNGALAVFDRQKPDELVAFLTGLCRRAGVGIDRRTAESLVDRCEASMQMIRSETTKLLLYCAAEHVTSIDLPLVDALCVQDVRGGIFDLTDAIASGRTDQAVRLLQALLFRKEPTTLIRFLLARHVRNLLIAHGAQSDGALASMAGIPPFVASRLRMQARKTPAAPLESFYLRCRDNDFAVKSGKMPDLLALETLVVSACDLFASSTLT
ncbi:MAG: DNA polymerase III subunit delta [Clostridiaceae bacterium]|nr:DNA polymerase III subunit delta [Clostridiaceae bacterium]